MSDQCRHSGCGWWAHREIDPPLWLALGMNLPTRYSQPGPFLRPPNRNQKKHMWSSWLHYDLTCCSQKCSSELRGKQAERGSANPRLWSSAGKGSNQFNVATRERVDGMQRSWLSGQSTFWLPPMVMSFGSWPWMYDKNWIPDSQYSNTAIAACCQHKNMDHNKSFYCIIWSYRLSF